MNIQAVIFDYFGVISSDEYWTYVSKDRQEDSVFRTYTDEVNSGKIHWEEFVEKVAEKTGTSITQVNEMYAREKLNPLVVGLIHEVHKKYKTGLITNAHHEFIDQLLEQNHLSELFDVIVVSSRLGIVKPDPRIFEYALEQLQVPAQETIFIDDLARHVNSAAELGIHAILYQDFSQAKLELDKLLASDS